MGYTRKYLVRSAAMVALLWLGAAQAHSVLHRFDPGSGAATPPRVMTIAEEMVDLRADAVRHARAVALDLAFGASVRDPDLSAASQELQAADLAASALVNRSARQAATIAEEMVDLRRELTCLREVASRMDAGATALRGAPANSVCFTRPTLVA